MAEWITVKEAGELLKISDRQVINRIHRGKLKARKDGRLWQVHSSLSEEAPVTGEALTVTEEVPSKAGEAAQVTGETDLVKELKERILDQKEQIARMEERLASESDRRDALILQITRITEQNQLLLEDKRSPFWKRWFGKNDTPGG